MLNDKKVPCISPIFHDNKFVTDFRKKNDLFNSCFFQNNAQLLKITILSSSTIPFTDQYLANIELTKDDIERIICKLDSNKDYGHDMTSVCMLKISGDAIIESLLEIFKNRLKCVVFPDNWKKGNIVPIFKKGETKHKKLWSSVSSSNLWQDFQTYRIR